MVTCFRAATVSKDGSWKFWDTDGTYVKLTLSFYS